MPDNTAVLAVAVPQIQRDEGCRLHAYPDPLSGAEPWTVGYGATGPSITASTVWTQEQADSDLAARLDDLCGDLDAHLAWWRGIGPVRGAVLVNMAYNLGLHGLLGFPHTLACVQASDWQGAHDGMLNSAWAKQVGARATRLANQMLTGEPQ